MPYIGDVMSTVIETLILSGILHVPDFQLKVFPHLYSEIFEQDDVKTVFELTKTYHDKFSHLPTKESLEVELENKSGIPEEVYQKTVTLIDKLYSEKVITGIRNQNSDWMIKTTETHVKNRACYLAVIDSFSIVSGDDKKRSRDIIPDLLKEAVNISFDNEIGHDYIEDYMKRYEFYHDVQERIPFELSMLNHITGGGFPKKTLLCPISGTGKGKSAFCSSMASFLLTQGYNVLYVTLEMADMRMGERMDAKLFNMTIGDVHTASKDVFSDKISELKNKKLGKLILKEYPTGSINCNHLKNLLNELKSKKGFVPDVIIVDYMNLLLSYRAPQNSNSYTTMKLVAEELRNVAQCHNACVISPSQFNRDGQNNADVELENVSECISPLSEIITKNGIKFLKDVAVGEQILGSRGWVTVLIKHHPKVKKSYKIKTKSGKEIICSSNHQFPTDIGRVSIVNGLTTGTKLKTL